MVFPAAAHPYQETRIAKKEHDPSRQAHYGVGCDSDRNQKGRNEHSDNRISETFFHRSPYKSFLLRNPHPESRLPLQPGKREAEPRIRNPKIINKGRFSKYFCAFRFAGPVSRRQSKGFSLLFRKQWLSLRRFAYRTRPFRRPGGARPGRIRPAGAGSRRHAAGAETQGRQTYTNITKLIL